MNENQIENQLSQQYDQIRTNGRGGTRVQDNLPQIEEEKKEEPEPMTENRQKKIVIRVDRNLSPPVRNGAAQGTPAQSRGSQHKSRHQSSS